MTKIWEILRREREKNNIFKLRTRPIQKKKEKKEQKK